MTAPAVSALQLAAKLAPQQPCACTPTTVCPTHTSEYPDGPPKCAAGCGEALDPILWAHGLHVGCVRSAPIPPQPPIGQATTPSFSAPAGPRIHPIKQELIEVIRWASASAPRSLQRAVGPSEIGVDCMRRLAYRYGGAQPVNTASDPWFSIVGTSVHDWLDTAINRWCATAQPEGSKYWATPRYITEKRVTATSDQHGVSGSCDLYDVERATVIDHKVVGHTALKKYTDQGPSSQYRTQVHLYGKGYRQAGYPVEEVAIAFYPRSGYLTDLHVWAEPYNETVADQALARAATIQQLTKVLPVGQIPAHPDQAACTWCPFYRPGGPADATGCPGPQG